MKRTLLLAGAVGPALGAAAPCAPALAQDWPAKPITLVMRFPPGGGTNGGSRVRWRRS